MNHRKKKIVATCMVVYMGTLALPQTPAHAHESDQTAVIQPAGEHASIHTDLEIPTTTEEPALVQPSLDEAGTPQTEPNTTVTPEGSLEEENAGGNDPQPAGDPDSEEEELELTEPTMQPDGHQNHPGNGHDVCLSCAARSRSQPGSGDHCKGGYYGADADQHGSI